MPRYKTLLINSEWKLAGKQRKCYHSPTHSIAKGENVLEVSVDPGVHGYCKMCGEAMIAAAIDKLNQMHPLQ